MVDFAIVHYNKKDRKEVELDKELYREKLLAAIKKLGNAIKNGDLVNYRTIKDVDGTIFFIHMIGVNGKHAPMVVWMDREGDDGDIFRAGGGP